MSASHSQAEVSGSEKTDSSPEGAQPKLITPEEAEPNSTISSETSKLIVPDAGCERKISFQTPKSDDENYAEDQFDEEISEGAEPNLTEDSDQEDGSHSAASTVSQLSKSIDFDLDSPRKSLTFELPSESSEGYEFFHEVKEESLLFEDDRVSPSIPTGPCHFSQRSDDSTTTTNYTGSTSSFRNRFSHFSIDNSCFDLGALTGENSTVGTPIEKVFPRDEFSSILLERVASFEKQLNQQKEKIASSRDVISRAATIDVVVDDVTISINDVTETDDVTKPDDVMSPTSDVTLAGDVITFEDTVISAKTEASPTIHDAENVKDSSKNDIVVPPEDHSNAQIRAKQGTSATDDVITSSGDITFSSSEQIGDVTRKVSDVSRKVSDVSRRSDVTRNISDVTRNISDVTKKNNDVTRKNSDVTRKNSDVTRKNSDVTRKNSDVIRKKSDVISPPPVVFSLADPMETSTENVVEEMKEKAAEDWKKEETINCVPGDTVATRKGHSLTSMRSNDSFPSIPSGRVTVQMRSGRRSIRRKTAAHSMNETSLPPRPPRLNLVVGGPGCDSAPFPPSPISPTCPMDTDKLLQDQLPGTSTQPQLGHAHWDADTVAPTRKKSERHHRKQVGRQVGNLRLIETLRVKVLQLKGLRGNASRPLFVVAKLDHRDIHHSTSISRDCCDPVIEEFFHDGCVSFSNFHLVVLEGSRAPGKAPRPIGRISLKRREVVRLSGKEMVLPLRVVSKCQEVQGQICLDIRRENGRFAVRVVDYCGLGLREQQELYLLVTNNNNNKESKLRIHEGRFSEEWLELSCEDGSLNLKMTLWHDLLRGLNSVFHGQVRVEVDEKWTNGPSKWFYLRPRSSEQKDENEKENLAKDGLGEVKIWMSYTESHVLPADTYRPLMSALSASLTVKPFSASLISLLEHLPQVDLNVVARPLVQTLAYSKSLRPLLISLYTAEIDKCQDYNTLFRSQSLGSKMLYELLKIYGHSYLLISLKTVIDKIYKEKKCCEIDPARLPAGDTSIEKNTTTLLHYFSLIFSRLTESASRCPIPIKSILSDLRAVVAEKTGRPDVERLALSSFLIMRFFAAAILNPKLFGLKRDQPEPRVARTLVLLSKMLQRLANCCVSELPLNNKEPWLSPVLLRISDASHRAAMCSFIDRISLTVPEQSLSSETVPVIKEGYLLETRARCRPAWRQLLHQKKRFVMLTDKEVLWQKSHRGDLNPKGSIPLTSMRTVTVENKQVVVMKTDTEEVAFETTSTAEAAEWMTSIDRQRNRARRFSSKTELTDLFDSDVEREMEALHMLLIEHVNTLTVWRSCIEGELPIPQGTPPIPNFLQGKHLQEESREEHKTTLLATLQQILNASYSIETVHQDAIDVYMKTMSEATGTRENPIGDDNYLLLKRKLHLNTLTN